MNGAILVGTLVAGKLHAEYIGDYDLSNSFRFGWLLVFAFVGMATAYAFGLPEKPSLKGIVLTSLASALVPPTAVALIQTVVGEFILPRFVLFVWIPIGLVVYLSAAIASRHFRQSNIGREGVVLLCNTQIAQLVRADLEIHSEIPSSIVATIDPMLVEPDELLIERTKSEGSLVVLGADSALNEEWLKALSMVHAEGVRIRTMSDFYDSYLGKVPIRDLELESLLFDVREVHHSFYGRASRAFDIVVGMIGLLFLSLVIPFVMLGNVLGNRGPLFYSQDRVGKGMLQFRILKFRSMVPGGGGTQWTSHDDPRITPFGRFLRLSHLDELPQVLNILRGDLSIVGPRPEQPHYVEELVREIPYYEVRHLVRPGLTGWAQVNYPYGADKVDAYEKLQFDVWYLRHQSLLLDITIVARTVRHVLGFQGR